MAALTQKFENDELGEQTNKERQHKQRVWLIVRYVIEIHIFEHNVTIAQRLQLRRNLGLQSFIWVVSFVVVTSVYREVERR